MATNLYPYDVASLYVLTRDGVEVMRGSEVECWQYLHRAHPYSVEHALRFEGYKMDPAPRGR